MIFENPAGLLLLISLPLLLLLHLLLRTVHRRTVASTFLWEQLLRHRGRRARSIRILTSLLVLLQAAALLLIGTAAGLPRLRLPQRGFEGGTIVVVDVSASMAGPSGGTTRLRDAVALAEDELARRRGPYTLVAVGEKSEILLRGSRQRSEVTALLNGLTPSAGGMPIADEIDTLLRTLGDGGRREILVYSDGGAPEALRETANLSWRRIGSAGRNRGILSFSALPWGDSLAVRAQIGNFADIPDRVILEYEYGDTLRELEVRLAAGETREVRLDTPRNLPSAGDVPDELRLSLVGDDDLAADDTALLDLEAREISVRISGTPDPFLEAALRALERSRLIRRTAAPLLATSGPPSVLIVSGEDAGRIDDPSQPSIRFNTTPLRSGIEGRGEIRDLHAVAVAPGHPLLGGVAFSPFRVARAENVLLPPRAVPLFAEGTEALISFLAVGGGHLLFHFDLRDSDLPAREEFPLLITRALLYLSDREEIARGAFVAAVPGIAESDINRGLDEPEEASPPGGLPSANESARAELPLIKLLLALALLVLTAEALLQAVRWGEA